MHNRILHRSLLAAAVSASLAFAGAQAQDNQRTTRDTQQTQQTAQSGQVGQYQMGQDQRTRAQAGQQTAQAELNRKDRKFIGKALSSGAAEIELGQLAEQRASSDDVRQFARTLQQHHRQTNQQLAAMSTEHSADAAEPDSKHQRKMDKLAEIDDGRRFDAAYTELAIELHQADIELFEEVADNDDYSPQVRSFARNTLDDLRSHLQMAQRLDQQVGRVAGVDDDD